jgi:DNA excision repair protein ERCC-2
MEVAEEWLVLNTPSDFRASLLELFFKTFGFVRTAELFDDRYVTIFEKEKEQQRYRLYCLDPAKGIQEALARGKGAIFFSATLRPIEYYREILGGEIGDAVLQLASPFPAEQLEVIIHRGVQTSFRARDTSYGKIARSIWAVIEARPGNYLVFFPSYKYLEAVRNEIRLCP